MSESNVVTSIERTRTSFNIQFEDFFKQFAFVNNHLLCYWPTIHNLISKICPKFQVLRSHFFEVDELPYEQWAKNVLSENISTPIYVECDEMLIKSLPSRILVNFAWPWYSTWAIKEQQSCKQKSSCRLWNTTSNIPFFSVDWHESMALWLRLVPVSQATLVQFSQGAETLCPVCRPSATLRGTVLLRSL